MTRILRIISAATILAAMLVLAPGASAQATEHPSYLMLDGTPGDFITQGNNILVSETDETGFFPTVNFDNGISVRIDVIENGVFQTRWHTNFAAPDEVPLQQGDVFSATRFPFQAAGTAGLSVYGDGRGCNQLTGDFVILELIFDAAGDVEHFEADFSQSCDGGPVMTGEVRVHPAPDVPPGDTTPPDAIAELTQTGRVRGTSSQFFVSAGCTDDNPGVELVSSEINGVPVADGQKVKLTLSTRERPPKYKKGILTIQSASIDLEVNCTDAAGNTASATAQPVYD